MKLLYIIGIIAAFILISGIWGDYKRGKTISLGNKQVSGNHIAVNPETGTYSAISNFLSGGIQY